MPLAGRRRECRGEPNDAESGAFFFAGLGLLPGVMCPMERRGSHEEVALGLVVEGECPALGELVK